MSEVIRLGTQAKRLDVELIEKGERLEAPMAPGVFVTVLPWGDHNKLFRKALRTRATREAMGGKTGAPEGDEVRDYLVDRTEDPGFVVDALILDIEGLVDAEGDPLPYTKERALVILKNPAWSHFLNWIVGNAFRLSNRYVEDTVAVGNSSRPASSGRKAGAAKSVRTKS